MDEQRATEDGGELVGVAYPVSATRAIVIGPADDLDRLGRVEQPVSSVWMKLLRGPLGASGSAAEVAMAADGRFVRLTAESLQMLKHSQTVAGPGAGSVLGVVRNGVTGRFAGVLSFHSGTVTSMAVAMPSLLGAVALQAQLAAIEKKLDEIKVDLQYLIDQLHIEAEGELVASIDVLDRVYERAQRSGGIPDDDWDRVVAVERSVRSLHHQTTRNLERIANSLVPGGPMSERVRRLRTALRSQHARYWLTMHAQAELALTKWQWLEVMRLAAEEDLDEVLVVLEQTEREVVERRAALRRLADQMGAFLVTGEDRLLDRLRFFTRRSLTQLVGELEIVQAAFRSDIAPLGVDAARTPIALGTGEEADRAWTRLVEQVTAASLPVGKKLTDAGEKVLVPAKKAVAKARRRDA